MERNLVISIHPSTKITKNRRVRRSKFDNVGMDIGRNVIDEAKMTQGALSTLDPLSEGDVKGIISTMIEKGRGISIEWTIDPHPRNIYWNLWCSPLFPFKPKQATFQRDDQVTSDSVVRELNECFDLLGSIKWGKMDDDHYVKLSFFNPDRGIESTVLSFVVARPGDEPIFEMRRIEGPGRKIIYAFDVVRY